MSKKKKGVSLCGHLSPMTNKPCLKIYGHHETDKVIAHQNGAVTWGEWSAIETLDEFHPDSARLAQEAIEGVKQIHGLRDETVTFKGAFDADSGTFERLFANQPSVSINRVDLSPYISEITFGADPEPEPTPSEILAGWWRAKSEAEIGMVVDKAIEYGATDLVDIGRNVARLSDRDVTDQEAAMIGVFFYLEGKLARWRSAIHDKRPVSADTILDIGVYARMAQRIAEAGSWPGVELGEVPWSEKKVSGEVRP